MALYPPQIEGTIPAFCLEKGQIEIPFVMNKTVGWNEIDGFAIKIKNIQNNEIIATLNTLKKGVNEEIYSNHNKDKQVAYFDFDKNNNPFILGQSYKVQMCYITAIKDKDTGKITETKPATFEHYSTVGIIKCTAKPKVYIDGLGDSQLHSDTRTYVGVYSQKDKDVTEKVYSYNFTVYDEWGRVLETSGEQLHNHENNDKVYESTDSFTMIKSLEENKIYTIIYTVTTANGIVQSSSKYRITQQSTIPPEIEADLIATMNEENGYVNLQLIGKTDEYGIEKVGTGTFLICRASSEDDYGSWSEVDRFALFGEAPSSHSWKDFTVQHGFTYVYSLQQYNKEYQIYSNRMMSNEIIANFEHSFLYDGERQLKIKYNPKVSSFKETLLEQKTNTLGGKYPFFFRNGNVRYKEFPISGLISYLADEEELFLTDEDMLLESINGLQREHSLKENIKSTDYDYFNNMLDANQAYKLQQEYRKREQINSQENQITRKKDRTTNLTDYNVVAERIFKMTVLNFLNDGKPKLFRSPGEGNYIVRLMNSSLSPDDKLNRMLHTFSTTATEIDDCTYQKLNEYNLISTDEPDTKQLRWKTVNIRELINKKIEEKKEGVIKAVPDWITIGGENNIMSIQFIDMIPGDKFKIEFSAGDQQPLEIQIGATGAYYIEFDEAPQRVLISSKGLQGQVTYSYYGVNLHHFDTYRYIKMDDIPIIQLTKPTGDQDIREYYNLEDIKHKITKYYFLNFTKIDYIFEKQTLLLELERKMIKGIITKEEYQKEQTKIEDMYNRNKEFKIWIDDKEIDISETDDFQLIKPENIPKIILGPGVCLDISIQRREIEYDVESTVSIVARDKELHRQAKNHIRNYIIYNRSDVDYAIVVNEYNDDNVAGEMVQNKEEYENTLDELRRVETLAYNTFLFRLKTALKEKEVNLE